MCDQASIDCGRGAATAAAMFMWNTMAFSVCNTVVMISDPPGLPAMGFTVLETNVGATDSGRPVQ